MSKALKGMRYVLTIICILSLCASPVFAEPEQLVEIPAPGELTAESAILIDLSSGQVLFEKEADLPLYPASTTKVLTALMILESCPLSDHVIIDGESPYAGGSGIALEPGEDLTVEQLLGALLIASANDAAEALARHHSGSIDAFVAAMNEKAAELGARNSNFENPHGMPNSAHLTTARDLSIFSREAMKNEVFRQMVSTRRYEIPPTNKKSETRYLNSTNSFFPGIEGSTTRISVRGVDMQIADARVTGVKRGYTEQAQNCLITSAESGDRAFMTVVLKSNALGMYADTRLLMDYAFNGTAEHVIHLHSEPVETLILNNVQKTPIPLYTERDLALTLPKAVGIDSIQTDVLLSQDTQLPVSKGDVLGEMRLKQGERVLYSAPLISLEAYKGEDLVTDAMTFARENPRPFLSPKWFLHLGIRLLIAILLWRTVMTIGHLLRRRHTPTRKL